MKKRVWEILNKSGNEIVDILFVNRGITTRKEKAEFLAPTHPAQLSLKELGIDSKEVEKAIGRLKTAKEKKEKVIVYGDYDADGITAAAVVWEALYEFGIDALPYVPDRFSEGYGINAKSIKKLQEVHENKIKLIVTVDNGIVASEEIAKVKKMGIDVIVTDHHQTSKIKPKAYATIHTTQISGSAAAWMLAREIRKIDKDDASSAGLELVAVGTLADQMPLIGPNRSFAKHGLEKLRNTKRVGLIELARSAACDIKKAGVYEINYIIAPRINSMGRLKHGLSSLRLLCTKDALKAEEIARLISKTNLERQRIVDEITLDVRRKAQKLPEGVIFLSSEEYHEGVIGLAAGRLVEEFYRPSIVIAEGKEISKGSARSISGFNIVEVIREHASLLVAHGGHTMAAGFTIETAKLEEFRVGINKTSKKLLTTELLSRKLRVDCELAFNQIDWELVEKLKEFEPVGLGNPAALFVTYQVEVEEVKLLGAEKNHLKMKLKKDGKFFDAIGFNMGEVFKDIKKGTLIDIAYGVEENVWNGTRSLQLKLRDLKV